MSSILLSATPSLANTLMQSSVAFIEGSEGDVTRQMTSLASIASSVRSVKEAGVSMTTKALSRRIRSIASWTAGRVTSSARSGASAAITSRTSLWCRVTNRLKTSGSAATCSAEYFSRSASVYSGRRSRNMASFPNSTLRSSRPTVPAEETDIAIATLTARGVVLADQRQGLDPVARDAHPVSRTLEVRADHLLDQAVVVDEQDALARHLSDSRPSQRHQLGRDRLAELGRGITFQPRQGGGWVGT